jgi:hypothetical protein
MDDAPFKVGDHVTSPWDPIQGDLIRTVTDVRRNNDFSSGWAISTDNGGFAETKPIITIDSSWFFHAKPLCDI